VLKAGFIALNILAWNDKIRLNFYFVGYENFVMINRNRRGYWYLKVRGEILGFFTDQRLRKHLTRMFPLIKNESAGIKDD